MTNAKTDVPKTAEVKGLVTSFRRSKHKVKAEETIVAVAGDTEPVRLLGAKAVWVREDGFRITGRVVAQHGNGRTVRIRWKKGFPATGLGTPVTMYPPA